MTLPIATPPRNTTLILSRYAAYGQYGGAWWTGRGYPNSIPTLTWTEPTGSYSQELAVRGAAMNAFALAVNDPANVTTARLVAAISRQHAANGVAGLQTWGYTWQSPLWAAWAGLAAMVGWDGIPNTTERDNVRRMLIAEADNVVTNRPPLFWKTPAGVETYPGDSKAEENSWCATVLWVAAALMPTAPNVSTWLSVADDLAVSAFARSGDDSRGSNVTTGNLVINHNRVHPDYMTSTGQNFFSVVPFELVGRTPHSIAALGPVARMYSALQSTPLDASGTLAYATDSASINFPVGTVNDWGNRRPAAYAALDGLVALYGIDSAAAFYSSIHLADLASMQARPAVTGFPAGTFTRASTEGNYPEENAYSACQVAFLALAYKAQAQFYRV